MAATKASRGYRPEPVPAKAGAGMTRWAKRRWVNLEGVWYNDRHSVPKAHIEAHDRRHPRCRRQIAQAAPLSGPTATFLPAIHLAIPHSIPSGVMVQNRDLRCSHANRVVMFGRRSLGLPGLFNAPESRSAWLSRSRGFARRAGSEQTHLRCLRFNLPCFATRIRR